MNMCQPDEAKSGPRKRQKKNKSNNIFTACFGIICDDDEEPRPPLKLRKLPRHEDHDGTKKWSAKRSEAVKKRASCDVESEKAKAQRRYDYKTKRNILSHNLIIPSSSNSNNPNQKQQQQQQQQTMVLSTEVVAQNPTWEKYVDQLPNNNTTSSGGKKLDPVLGFSVVLVTMVIIILWGRLCAILCTSAWFYFISKFKSSSTAYPAAAGEPPLIRLDLESEEYKKKVVLEGFLERKRR